jgi:hypothetical protein
MNSRGIVSKNHAQVIHIIPIYPHFLRLLHILGVRVHFFILTHTPLAMPPDRRWATWRGGETTHFARQPNSCVPPQGGALSQRNLARRGGQIAASLNPSRSSCHPHVGLCSAPGGLPKARPHPLPPQHHLPLLLASPDRGVDGVPS